MKKIMAVMLGCLFLAVSALPLLAADPVLVEKAQELKAKGDYVGAAAVHPKKLCDAIYLWNAACQKIGHRDARNDWAINKVIKTADKVTALALLDQAQEALKSSADQAGTENEGCKGVDPDTLQELIDKVRVAVEGHDTV